MVEIGFISKLCRDCIMHCISAVGLHLQHIYFKYRSCGKAWKCISHLLCLNDLMNECVPVREVCDVLKDQLVI